MNLEGRVNGHEPLAARIEHEIKELDHAVHADLDPASLYSRRLALVAQQYAEGSGRLSEVLSTIQRIRSFRGLTSGETTLEEEVLERFRGEKEAGVTRAVLPSQLSDLHQIYDPDADTEYLVIVDNIDELEGIKTAFEGCVSSIETELDVHEEHETGYAPLRVVLKHSDNGDETHSRVLAGLRATRGTVKYDDAHTPRERTHVALYTTNLEHTHGVPVVVNNIGTGMPEDIAVSYIANDFDTNTIRYQDTEGVSHEFKNRSELVEHLKKNEIEIDVLHSHTWHISDHYKPFHSERDPMALDEFIRGMSEDGRTRFVYTDHSNPTEDVRSIESIHSVRIDQMTPEERTRFLENNTLTNHSVEDWSKGWHATSILAREQMLNRAHITTNVSATQAQESAQLLGLEGPRSVVIQNGVDMHEYWNEATEEQSRAIREEKARDRPLVVYAGRISEDKGVLDLAHAVHELHETTQLNPVVAYIGEAADNVRSEIESIAGAANTVFVGKIGRGQRETLAAWYGAADVVAQPTWGECFNQVVPEAMMVGTPTITSDYSATGELYVSKGIAKGHTPRDSHSLAEGLGELLTDPDARETLAREGRAYAHEHFSVDAMRGRFANLYRALSTSSSTNAS
jgi:glycosyltransferase involved in cell wall biosynthesis